MPRKGFPIPLEVIIALKSLANCAFLKIDRPEEHFFGEGRPFESFRQDWKPPLNVSETKNNIQCAE
jgi:hypothetical protein